MAEESSPKRRRISGPFDYDSDDDELFLRPQDVSARRDPDYQLSVLRANADHKFQATMAHIIEKYSRNFEGVGDEIDMETGEIVVNNGHLHNMRDEGDVGEWVEDHNEDDDDGILLEDLTDYEGSDDDGDDAGEYDEEEEELIMRGREADTAEPSNSLVETKRRNPNNQDGKLSLLFPSPFGDPFSAPQFGFGASPLASNPSSSFAFGTSPLAMGPWGLPAGSSAPGLGHHHDSRMGHVPAANRLVAGTRSAKYEFPAQEGYNSIWSSGSGYEDDWAARPSVVRTGFRRYVPKRPLTTQKLLRAPQTVAQGGSDSDDNEEAIHTGQPSNNKALVDAVPNDTDGEDDLMISSTENVTTPAKPLPARMKGRSATRYKPREDPEIAQAPKPSQEKINPKKRKFQPPSEVIEQPPEPRKQLVAARIRKPSPEMVKDAPEDRRRSDRARRQTEFMGKITWMAPDRKRKAAEILTVELRRMDPIARKEFRWIDNADGCDGQPTPPASEISLEEEANEEEEESVAKAPQKAIPHSQDTGTPSTSSAPRGAQPSVPSYPGLTRKNGADPSGLLSDDEAPVMLPEAKKDPDSESQSIANNVPRDPNGSVSVSQQSKQRGRPKRTALATAGTSSQVRAKATAVQPEPEASPQIALHELELPKPRRRGKPRKSDNSQAVPSKPQPPSDQRVLEPDLKWLRPVASRQAITLNNDVPKKDSEGEAKMESRQPASPSPASAEEDVDLPSLPEQPPPPHKPVERSKYHVSTTPRRAKSKQHNSKEHVSSPLKPKPETPRHTAIRTSHAPYSRRSLLSLLSDDDDDDQDELARAVVSLPQLQGSGPPKRQLWRPSLLTTEVTATPTAKRIAGPGSLGNVVKTPGGTVRTCGLEGYTCGRDFCFACL